jgi:RNA polymerase sigma factor (sigma-70 family)
MNGLPVAGVLPVALSRHRADRLSALFDAHHDRLYRLARRLAPSADDALDLVQETFLKTARSSTEVPLGLSNEEAWLVRVLINVCRDQQRKVSRRKRHENEMSRSVTVEYDHEAALIARASVWRALDTLTTRRRAVVVMHELEGLGVPAIASLLGISAVTVRWHLSRGRRDLARAFRSHIGETNENR